MLSIPNTKKLLKIGRLVLETAVFENVDRQYETTPNQA